MHSFSIVFVLTREHSQVIGSVCLHILPTCKGYYSKKKPKRIWALIASFKSYEVFRFLYSKVSYITLKFSFPSETMNYWLNVFFMNALSTYQL